MTFIVGRRRIGKTRLIRQAMLKKKYLYFFIARKEESLLCEEFTELIQETLGIKIYGEIKKFSDIFELLMDHSMKKPLTLIIDEFQEFNRINPSVYSDIQNIWDSKKGESNMNLILCGSVFSMMKKIFENSKEPLFGRANERLYIKPFQVNILKKIMQEFKSDYKKEDLLAFYIFTGGVPKYIEHFVDKNCFSKKMILHEMLRENSLFLEEGKNVLIEEFGKDYTTYFSILSLIASSKTSRSAIESILQKDIGGYLSRLEKEYQIIKKVQPIFAKPGSKSIKYFIDDNFLNFWFRFIYKNKGAVEIGNFNYITKIINRDYSTFCGHFLEKYFREQLALSGEYSAIGNYWERGNTNEIDIVAINEMDKKALIGEVKLNRKNISLDALEVKAYALSRKLSGYKITYKGFSIEDI